MGQATLKAGGRMGRLWRLLKRAALVLLLLHLLARFLYDVPMKRYVATCSADMFKRTYVEGPYNEIFLFLLQHVMEMEDFFYIRTPSAIYVPYLGLSNETYEGYDHFSLNVDWKLVTGIARGIGFDSVRFRPPQPLVDLIEATKVKYGPFPRRNAAGAETFGSDDRFHESEDACAFMRAAILKEPESASPRGR